MFLHPRLPLLCSLLLSSAGVADVFGQDNAKYSVVFQATWSALSHPDGFPSNAHFSGLIGGTHDESVVFWEPGQIASDGIEEMAERGRKGALTAEVETAIASGSARYVLSGGGIGSSPNQVALDFEISVDHPLVTLVSMLAPSPDWFVGVTGLPLFENGAWVDELEIPLTVFDAGSDSGPAYTSPDDDTDPPQPITALMQTPFDQSGIVGTFRFMRRQTTVRQDGEEQPGRLEISGPYPNPVESTFRLDISGSQMGPVVIRLFDATGRHVGGRSFAASGAAAQTISVSVAGLPSGVYLLEARAAATVHRSSLVVAR